MFKVIIATKDDSLAKCLDDILFGISQVDDTFKYSKSRYGDKISFAILCETKKIAYSRGLLIKKYMNEKCGKDIGFRVKEVK